MCRERTQKPCESLPVELRPVSTHSSRTPGMELTWSSKNVWSVSTDEAGIDCLRERFLGETATVSPTYKSIRPVATAGAKGQSYSLPPRFRCREHVGLLQRPRLPSYVICPHSGHVRHSARRSSHSRVGPRLSPHVASSHLTMAYTPSPKPMNVRNPTSPKNGRWIANTAPASPIMLGLRRVASAARPHRRSRDAGLPSACPPELADSPSGASYTLSISSLRRLNLTMWQRKIRLSSSWVRICGRPEKLRAGPRRSSPSGAASTGPTLGPWNAASTTSRS